MRQGARLQASIEIIELFLQNRRPLSGLTKTYLRSRRYIGSKDRSSITSVVWGVIRSWSRLQYCLAIQGPDARLMVFALEMFNHHIDPEEIQNFCEKENYGPDSLTSSELSALKQAQERQKIKFPDHIGVECPEWLWPYFIGFYGDYAQKELSALTRQASVDLRVNTLRTDYDSVSSFLAEDGLTCHPMEFSHLGLRLEGRPNLEKSKAYKKGWVEIQDEGSQVVSLLVDAKPGHSVIDFCAGAGGKSLAMASTMNCHGRIVVADKDKKRLSKAERRLLRSGVTSSEILVLGPNKKRWLNQNRMLFDRVLVDAPCTGTGVWRRHPESRWTVNKESLSVRLAEQDSLLLESSYLVKTGGHLVYATCSLLPQENEERVNFFLSKCNGFEPVPVCQVWESVIGAPCPGNGDFLRLSPYSQGTDGFFVAILKRKN